MEKSFSFLRETPINIIQCTHSHLLKSTMFSTCNLLLEIGHAVCAVCALSADITVHGENFPFFIAFSRNEIKHMEILMAGIKHCRLHDRFHFMKK